MSTGSFSRDPVPTTPVQTAYRTIQTPIPAPGTRELLERLERVESRSMQGQLPIVWDKAEDFSVYDHAGNRWIDFTSTIFVTNVGHANAAILEAVKKGLERPLVHTYAYMSETRLAYLEALVSFSGLKDAKAFLLSAGTEATEAALKLMRMNAQRVGKRRPGIVCFEGNWHGRTLGAQLMGGNEAQKQWVGYRDPNIHHIPFPYPWTAAGQDPEAFFEAGMDSLRAAGIDPDKDVGGFLLETFQGWGAVFYPEKYVHALERFARERGILIAFDEMQAGFGRTGRRFGYEHYGVTPDLVCCGKGMGSGFPLSGVVGRRDLMDLPEVGNMSSTHSANPVACVAGLATLREIADKDLVAEAARKGLLLHNALGAMQARFPDRISHVLGRGMIAAPIFCDPKTGGPDTGIGTPTSELCMRKGLLVVHTGRESIKIGPPLTIPDDALLEGIAVLEEAFAEVVAGRTP